MIENSGKIAWIILNAVKNLDLGKYKLAAFLKGSKSKKIEYFSDKQGYGGLLWHDIPTIIGFIEQLEEMEFIKRKSLHQVGEYYEVLELTEAGKKILEQKTEVPLQTRKKEALLKVGDTEKTTYKLFISGKSILEIAEERRLVISTIYDHLHNLVANGYMSSSDFVPEDKSEEIIDAYYQFSSPPKLKELKNILPENISYEEIKCVLADKVKKMESKIA